MKMRNQISKRQLSQGTSHMGMKEIKKVPKQECEIIQLLNRAHKPRTKKKKMYPIQNMSMIRSQGHIAQVDLHGFKMVHSKPKSGMSSEACR